MSSVQEKEIKSQVCQMIGERVGKTECQSRCSSPDTNLRYCSQRYSCASPYRFCKHCVVYCGLGRKAMLATHPEVGVCDFHYRYPKATPSDRVLKEEREKRGEMFRKAEVLAQVIPIQAAKPKEETAQARPDIYGREIELDCAHIERMPGQPRVYFDPVKMRELQKSIAEIGQQEPITVIPHPEKPGYFRIRDGERRWTVCARLGRPVKAIVREALANDELEFETSITLNLHREGHTPYEMALAMQRLKTGPLQRSMAQISATFGCSVPTVNNWLLLLNKLPREVFHMMNPAENQGFALKQSVALRLTSLYEYPKLQTKLAKAIISVRMETIAAHKFIEHHSAKLRVNKGRGLELKPSDRVRTLTTNLRRVELSVSQFIADKNALAEAFRKSAPGRKEEFLKLLDMTMEKLTLVGEVIRIGK